MDQIKINQKILAVLLAHTQAYYPQEVCGFLAGEGAYAYHLYMIENVLRSAVNYEMDAQQQIEAMLHVEDLDLALLATYHSHPASPAWPSATDIAQAYYPDLLYLIVSLSDRLRPEIKAFKIENNEVEEIKIVVE